MLQTLNTPADRAIKSLSFVIPVKDEADTLESLSQKIIEITARYADLDCEVIFIDDGSQDQSWSIMNDLANQYPQQVKAMRLRRNFGKATALSLGFSECQGDVVFTMDADLQDDPEEIPKFLEKIAEGFDVVSGWKQNRQDPKSKTWPSKLFNKITAKMSGISLHDFNCGFKAYRREAIEDLQLYGELHRYIPVLAHDLGFRIGEVAVKHHERQFGVSKYGWERYARGFVDLLTVLATTRYLRKPGHLFGGVGMAFGVIGSLILAYLATLWFMGAGPIGTRPLFFVGILLVILSIQLLSIGILAELMNRHAPARPHEAIVSESTFQSKQSQSS